MRPFAIIVLIIIVSGTGAPRLFFSAPARAAVDVTASVQGCGDAVIQVGEECDGGNLNGETCASLGVPGTGLSCNANCTFATSSCAVPPPPPPPPGSGGGGGGGGGATFFGTLVDFLESALETTGILPRHASGCPEKGDLNGDCKVDIIDFSMLVYWLDRGGFPPEIDVSGNGTIGLADLSIMVYYWTE